MDEVGGGCSLTLALMCLSHHHGTQIFLKNNRPATMVAATPLAATNFITRLPSPQVPG